MLSKSWKKELVDRSILIGKALDDLGIKNELAGIGGQGIQYVVATSQSLDDLTRKLFRQWPDVAGIQISKNCDSNSRVINVLFDVAEYDANAPVGREDDGIDDLERSAP